MEKKKQKFDTIDEYIRLFPAPVQKKLKELRSVIRAQAPLAQEKISYRMPTFYLNGNLVFFAAYANHIGFYPTASGIQEFKSKVVKYKNAKGSVQFPLDEPLPIQLIGKIVKFRVKENERRTRTGSTLRRSRTSSDEGIGKHAVVIKEETMQKITPFIWFEQGAKDAAKFYVKVFGRPSKIKKVQTVTDTPSGTVEVVSLDLRGQEFNLMAAGPFRKINEAISFVVNCKTQKEVDHFWEKLSEGGEKGQCGWLKDKYGVSWQVVPTMLTKLMADPDPVKAGRVTQAMLTMTKIDIAKLKAAYKGK